jgi:hypothetical protein
LEAGENLTMTITNGLCTLSDVKTAMAVYDNTDDGRIELAINTASRMIEAACNRRFYADSVATARVYTATTYTLTLTDDISTTSGLIVETDPGAMGTFSQTMTSSDYQLEPLNGIIDGQSWPYTQIRAIRSVTFPTDYGQALVRVTAKWGWSAVPDPIKQAGIIQTIAIFKAAEAPFGALGLAETGILRIRTGLHPTVAGLIAPYRRDPVLVA